MGTIWVKELTGGLDARRLAETASGGTLYAATDGHITDGGEFEKRAAFINTHNLPAGTVGLAAGRNSLYAFGHAAAPTMPDGILYQRLQHQDGMTALTRVLSYDLFAGKLYVAAEFADGSRAHFYDGVRVANWYDGRAHAAFTVTGGNAVGPSTLSDLTVDGVSIIGSPVEWAVSHANTAELIADEINGHTSVPGYSATAVGAVVNIVADDAGSASNGLAVVASVADSLVLDPSSGLLLAGGADVGDGTAATGSFHMNGAGTSSPGVNRIVDVTVGGVSIINAPVDYVTGTLNMANAMVAAINGHTSSPNYTAYNGETNTVYIVASDVGFWANGLSVVVTVGGDVGVSNVQAMAGGVDEDAIFTPGPFVKTIGAKMHSVSGPNEHQSGILAPTEWSTDAIGAGFVDMSTQADNSEELVALAKYQTYVAVFAQRAVQVWFFDPDPALNRQIQVLSNTGTGSARSVTPFGDNDLFYLDESGCRSLRARDSSNAAATTDIGVPVDSLIRAQLATLTNEQRSKVFGLIEPKGGRFWLVMVDKIFVFSFFSGAKVSAWSQYIPSGETEDVPDTVVVADFDVDEAVVFDKRVYLRSGNRVFCYGGEGDALEYDGVAAIARLPFLDAEDPTRAKKWDGLDAAVRGLWQVRTAQNINEEDTFDEPNMVFRTTFNDGRIPIEGESTHISVEFRTTGREAAKLAAVVIHYDSDADED